MPTENRSSSNPGARTFTLDSLVAALEQVQALHEISADLIAERIFGQPAEQHQGEQATCSHEWTDDGEWVLICTRCGAQENHEPYGWVQTRGPAINQFTQEWDIVQEWEDQGFQYKAMHDHPAPADAGEFERLCFDLAEMTKSYEALGELYTGTQKGFERLQAERKELLHEWRNSKGMTLEQSISLIERIEAALSASAEPEERS